LVALIAIVGGRWAFGGRVLLEDSLVHGERRGHQVGDFATSNIFICVHTKDKVVSCHFPSSHVYYSEIQKEVFSWINNSFWVFKAKILLMLFPDHPFASDSARPVRGIDTNGPTFFSNLLFLEVGPKPSILVPAVLSSADDMMNAFICCTYSYTTMLNMFGTFHLFLVATENGFVVCQLAEHSLMPLVVGCDFGPA
jgi:hypothetical protein